MYELIVVACLIAHPARCEEFALPFQQPMGITECLRESQFHLVEWLTGHSGWKIRRWSCVIPARIVGTHGALREPDMPRGPGRAGEPPGI